MVKLYKIIVLFIILTAMNNVVKAQVNSRSAIFSESKSINQEVGFSNYPNPATSYTTVTYNLNEKSKVTLKVLDLTGKQLVVLINADQAAGKKEFYWDFTKNKITSGMYILILKINNAAYSRKVIVQ